MLEKLSLPLILAVIKSAIRSPRRVYRALFHRDSVQQAQRWLSQTSLNPEWNERTKRMAALIPANSAVLEFGSGDEKLELWLPEGCSYQPSDITARSAKTLVCDLNQAFPVLPRHYDVTVFSGVLEYIHDVPALLAQVRKHSDSCVMSYITLDRLSCLPSRLDSDFVNHFTNNQILEIIKKAGFELKAKQNWGDFNNIYYLS